jgi:DNA polymerase III subunit gamma/tau
MSYQVLARKWRPRTFSELVGQTHVVRPLTNALDHDRVHHAFLFTGTRGVGKTTIARILAKSLNCERGVSSSPCGECQACHEVDEGRFIDLIEVDAASRTKVDDTRELLDNVQYSPTRGRYKVYLIDEVHMLSGHSFNALLKTLEEPPPHVKFLLATTDPQKLPVTVLSRCLQFNLKRLTREEITSQLTKILETEGISFERAALGLIARMADGSMRDALSLMDQAIAYGAGEIKQAEVSAMLGTIDQDAVERALNALIGSDAQALMRVVQDVMEFSANIDTILNELLLAFHQIALVQTDMSLAESIDRPSLSSFAERISAEDIQLFYQIGVLGLRDLPFAPDRRTAVEMTLLRMLAFRPVLDGEKGQLRSNLTEKPVAIQPAAKATRTVSADADWSEVVTQLQLDGLMRELVNHMTLRSRDPSSLILILDDSQAQLWNKEREQTLRKALNKYFGQIKVTVELGTPTAETPSQAKQRAVKEQQKAAVEAIESDPNVQMIQEEFNARVVPTSVRPK